MHAKEDQILKNQYATTTFTGQLPMVSFLYVQAETHLEDNNAKSNQEHRDRDVLQAAKDAAENISTAFMHMWDSLKAHWYAHGHQH